MDWVEQTDSFGSKSWETRFKGFEVYVVEDDGTFHWMVVKNERVVIRGEEYTVDEAKDAALNPLHVTPEDFDVIERYANGE